MWSDKRVSEMALYRNLLVLEIASFDSPGFGFKSRGAHSVVVVVVAHSVAGGEKRLDQNPFQEFRLPRLMAVKRCVPAHVRDRLRQSRCQRDLAGRR